MGVEEGAAVGVTELLARHRGGDAEAMALLMPLVYEELRRLARRQVGGGGRDATLDTTALVHEAFVKLSESERPLWQDRCHFMALAATAMRQILVDHARRRSAGKRGGGVRPMPLDEARIVVEEQAETLVAMDDALQELARLNPRLGQVVEFRFFGGMTNPEMAEALAVDERTVRRDWQKARAWLHQALSV